MKLEQDLHIHTYLSSCCKEKEEQTPLNIISLAEKMGLKTIGFADHLWVNPDITPSNWYRPQDETQIKRVRGDLSEISSELRVLVGCEADMIALGQFGINQEFAERLDFVLLSCGHFHMKSFVEQPASDTPRGLADHMLNFFRSGVTGGFATSIAHPLKPCGYLEMYDKAVNTISDSELLDAFGLAEENEVALEITTGFLPHVGGNFSIETPIRILSLAKQAGCQFTLGTDAHNSSRQKKLPELSVFTETLSIKSEDIKQV